MPHARSRLRGLSAKLALFFVALAFPALLLVESSILTFEFRRVAKDVERGALRSAAETAAAMLGARMDSSPTVLDDWLDGWLLRLTNPRGGLSEEGAFVLLELSKQPFGAVLYDAEGLLVAHSGMDFALAGPARAAARRGETIEAASSGGPTYWRTVVVPVRDRSGAYAGTLAVRLELPLPWRKLLLDFSFEWPILFAYMVVFALATAFFFGFYVTRRLTRIANAAERWSRGDFSGAIDDQSGDELGYLSRRLDLMAQELAEHFATRAQLASLEERQRLARDLHDTVKQKAFALNLQLGAAQSLLERDPTAARTRVHDATRLIEQIQHELNAVIEQLQHDATDDRLAQRAGDAASDWSRRSGIALEWTRRDEPHAPLWLQEQVLRILEEALANVWRHSAATRVRVSLVAHAGTMELNVADDGSGTAADGRGMGTRNMRERALMLPGGRFEIESRPGTGTRVGVSWREGAHGTQDEGDKA